MSGINGLGGVSSFERTNGIAPRPPVVQSSSASSQSSLQSVQRLMSQIETSANTKAIPAHQNW